MKVYRTLKAGAVVMLSGALTLGMPFAAIAEEIATTAQTEDAIELQQEAESSAESDVTIEAEASAETDAADAASATNYEEALNLAANDGDTAVDNGAAENESAEEELALSASQATSSVTGVTLGSGTIVTRKATVDQQAVYKDALARVIYWRKDALNDSRIKFYYSDSYITVKQYLAKRGISESDYLNPKWSTYLEKIAIQRAVEARYTSELGHTRPDGTPWSSAEINGYGASSEILAWNYTTSGKYAVDQWAAEKSDYIKAVNGETHGQVGHYVALISPNYTYYGFAGVFDSAGFWYQWAGEMGGSWIGSAGGSSPTNLKGEYTFEAAFSDTLVNKGTTWSGKSTLCPGVTSQYGVTLNYDSRYSVKGTWTSSNTKVAAVDNTGKVKAVAAGQATLTLTAAGSGKTFTKTITVSKNHTWDSGKVTKAATCGATGVKTYTCSICGTTKTETIAKTNKHTWGAWKTTKAASCKATGTKQRGCSVCGTKQTQAIAKTAHTWDSGKVTKKSTTTATGTKVYTCKVCKITKSETIAKIVPVTMYRLYNPSVTN